MEEQCIVIVGGGFAGVKTALELQKKESSKLKIILISDKDNFEYHGALYYLVPGQEPLEVCIPLRNILDENEVEIVHDSIVHIQTEEQLLEGSSGSKYQYDRLILALGSETNFFDIPGLKKYSHGMKDVDDALRLKRHIDESIKLCTVHDKKKQLCAGRFVVVGGGATGVELASELIVYAKAKALEKGVHQSIISVDLIESSNRLLPTMTEDISNKVEKRVRSIGINVHLNREVLSEEMTGVALRDMDLKSSTIIWTAGVSANHLYKELSQAQFDNKGRVHVNRHKYAIGYKNIFVVGDGAATQYSGMAQTALAHAADVVDAILGDIENTDIRYVIDKKPIYAIPVGVRWSATSIGVYAFYGYIGWMIRRVLDFFIFHSFLSFFEAFHLFRSNHNLSCKDVKKN